MEQEIVSDKARLYYEAHITIDPAAADELENGLVGKALREAGWRVSTFLMRGEGPRANAFISCRDESLTRIKERTAVATEYLDARGFPVLRWKIEDTLLDSKHGDGREMLTV